MEPNKKSYYCHFELTLDIIGGKWKPLILYFIGMNKVLRYRELRRKIPNISERMLTRQLRDLEKNKLVNREIYREVPPKVEYSLTTTGESLMPILKELQVWGMAYNNEMEIANFIIKKD